VGGAGQPVRAGAAHARPLRAPGRRGGVPPGLAPAARRRRRGGPGRCALGRRPPGRARRAGRRLLHLGAGRGRARLPGVDDLRRGAGAAAGPGARRAVRAAAHLARVRAWPARSARQARPARRHGDDREAGRLGRPGGHHGRHRRRRRHLAAARPQVVHERADVRRVPRSRAGPGRAVVLPRAAGAAGRHAQRLPHPAPEGQARQPLERLLRARVRRHRRLAGRRGGPRRPHDHRDGRDDAAGLPARLGVRDAPRPGAGGAPRPAPQCVRRPAGRQAAHAERAGRPRCRVGGRHHPRDAAGGRRRPGRARRPGGAGLQAARGRRGQVLGVQAAAGDGRRGAGVPRRQRLRRGVRSAAAVPRGAAQLDLGGLGQRPGARRPARHGARAGVGRRAVRRARPGQGRRPAPGRRRDRPQGRVAGSGRRRGARPPARRADGAGAAGLAARAARTGGRRGRVLRLAAGRRPRPGVRHAAPGHRPRGGPRPRLPLCCVRPGGHSRRRGRRTRGARTARRPGPLLGTGPCAGSTQAF